MSDVIHKENDFLHDALAEIVKYDPKVKNRLNLVQLSVLGTDLYFPNRYRVSHLEDGLSLSTDIRGRLNLYGCHVTEDLRLGFGGRISIGQIENCPHCSTPEKPKEKGITVVEKQISDEIKLRLVTVESHKATIAYIFRGNVYLEILDSNQELYKYILFQLNGYK